MLIKSNGTVVLLDGRGFLIRELGKDILAPSGFGASASEQVVIVKDEELALLQRRFRMVDRQLVSSDLRQLNSLGI